MAVITGQIYIEKVDGQWQTTDAEYVKDDPENPGRVLVIVYPTPPTDPVTPISVQYVSALSSGSPPDAGRYVYVAY